MLDQRPRRIKANDRGEEGGGALPSKPPLFELGQIVITAAALELNEEDVRVALWSHQRGDWGELDSEDWEANQTALLEGHRIFSVYQDRHQTSFYIITEWDRSATTVLLPSDY